MALQRCTKSLFSTNTVNGTGMDVTLTLNEATQSNPFINTDVSLVEFMYVVSIACRVELA